MTVQKIFLPEGKEIIVGGFKIDSSEESIKKHLQFYEEKVLPAMTHLSFSEMEALQNNRDLTVPAMHIVAKTWHVAECDSCKDLLTAAGLFP